MSDHEHDHHHSNSPSADRSRNCGSKRSSRSWSEKGPRRPGSRWTALIETYETKVGPHNGARVVARAWTDREYKQRLLENGTAAIKPNSATPGFRARTWWSSRIRIPFTTYSYAPSARAIRGRRWDCRRCGTRAAPYRSRVVSRAAQGPEGIRTEASTMTWRCGYGIQHRGATLHGAAGSGRRVRSESSEDELAALVTRDSMIGVARIEVPEAA